MEANRISFDVFKPFSKLVEDYLESNNDDVDFFPQRFSEESLIDAASHRIFSDAQRHTLVSSLHDQYNRDEIELPDITESQISKLNSANTFTITTGHQLCLFTGPLYFVLKILQVCKIAENLNSSNSNYNFVPVFWMASEDHDFEEINHTHIFGKTLKWESEEKGMVGDFKLNSMAPALESLRGMLGDSDLAKEIGSIFQEAYDSKRNLAAATRILVHRLFGERGLIIVDGNDVKLKREFVPYFKNEVAEQIIFKEHAEIDKKFKKSYKIQVNPRPINIFYLSENARKLIEFDGKSYSLKDGNKNWTQNELLQEIESKPERFSPNVVLRPMYQEKILPNICYVGGAAEVAYWLQLKSAFKEFDLQYPILNLRNSLIWLDKGKLKKMAKLDMSENDFFLEESQINRKIANFDDIESSLELDISSVKSAFESLSSKISKVDASLEASVLAEGRKIEKQLDQLKGKLLKAGKSKNEVRLNSFWNLHEKVFPGGNLHERYDNFVPYFLSYGWSFFDQIYEHLDPNDSRLLLIKDI